MIQQALTHSATCHSYPQTRTFRKNPKNTGINWKRNALRHSDISYRVAETSDVAKVSLEAGNSPQIIFQHYRELVTPEAGIEWFGILPGKAGNVIDLKQPE